MSHGNVAKNRYKIIERFCRVPVEASTTGHQKRRPVARKDRCSNRCQPTDCVPSAKKVGMCHPTKAAQAASQANLGLPKAFTHHVSARDCHIGRSFSSTNRRGKPCNTGPTGAPSQISRGANVMSSRCCSMWTVSNSWSRAAIGDAIATQMKNSPSKKLKARHAEVIFKALERRNSHPRRKTRAAKTKISVRNTDRDVHKPA